eukprot:1392334-Pyramimonas_sp.AAC.1
MISPIVVCQDSAVRRPRWTARASQAVSFKPKCLRVVPTYDIALDALKAWAPVTTVGEHAG